MLDDMHVVEILWCDDDRYFQSSKTTKTGMSLRLLPSIASLYEYNQTLLQMLKSALSVPQPSARGRSGATGPINRTIPASISLVYESVQQLRLNRAQESGDSTHTINGDGSHVHEYCMGVSQGSTLGVYLTIPKHEVGIDDGIKGRRSHKRERKAPERTSCWLSEASNEEHEYSCHQLSSELKLIITVITPAQVSEGVKLH